MADQVGPLQHGPVGGGAYHAQVVELMPPGTGRLPASFRWRALPTRRSISWASADAAAVLVGDDRRQRLALGVHGQPRRAHGVDGDGRPWPRRGRAVRHGVGQARSTDASGRPRPGCRRSDVLYGPWTTLPTSRPSRSTPALTEDEPKSKPRVSHGDTLRSRGPGSAERGNGRAFVSPGLRSRSESSCWTTGRSGPGRPDLRETNGHACSPGPDRGVALDQGQGARVLGGRVVGQPAGGRRGRRPTAGSRARCGRRSGRWPWPGRRRRPGR